MHERNAAAGLEALDELLFQGKDPTRFIEDFIYFYRDMLLYKTAPRLEESLERVLLDEDFQQLTEKIQYGTNLSNIDGLNKAQQEMRWTNHPRIFLEVAIVKLCQLENAKVSGGIDVEPILKRIEQLEEKLANLNEIRQCCCSNEPAGPKGEPQRPNRKEFQAHARKNKEVLKQATKTDLNAIKSNWGRLLEMLIAQQMRSQAALLNDAEPVASSNEAFSDKIQI